MNYQGFILQAASTFRNSLGVLGAAWPEFEREPSKVRHEYARLVRAIIAEESEGA